jgi:hypothetical protein
MYNESSSPTVTGCSFNGNSSTVNMGGGMANDHSSPTVSRCSFFDNDAYNYGGGMANFSGSSPTVASCIFSKNHTVLYPGGDDISNQGSGSLPTVINCTFYTEALLGYMMFNENSSPTVTNCIFWGFGDPIWNSGTSAPTVTFSVVPYSGTGNIWEDPTFVDSVNGDFHLLPSSPCIDAGDNSPPALPTTDIDGDNRRIDDPEVVDTGYGTPPIVDMGADEFNPPTPIFSDGFESGDCTAWSNTVGEVT